MRLQLPNVDELIQSLSKVVKRFPLSLLVAIIGTIAAVVGIENEADDEWILKVIMTAALGLPLFTAVKLLVESHKLDLVKSIVLHAIGALLLTYFFFQFQDEIQYRDGARFLALNLAFHLAVAIFPYIKKHDEDSFWYFNQYIFIRILTAALYSVVIFGGLSLAIAAVQVLFDVDIDGKRFAQLFAIIAGLFNTTFFLSGVPEKFHFDYRDDRYPKGLKVFAKYVLIPLCAVYLVILYMYGGKVILQWDWPNGWITWLVFGFALLGTLAYLLVAPLGRNEENQWVYNFCRWFFILIVPLSVLQLLAIYRRVDEYGLTENRYFVALLGLSLIILACYFVFSKAKSLKVIPIVLGSLSFLSVMGPWNAFQISMSSQTTAVLNDIKLYGESQDQDQKNKLSENIASRVDFLLDRKTGEEVYGLLGLDVPEDIEEDDFYARREILEELAIDPSQSIETYANYWTESTSEIDITGYEKLIALNGYRHSGDDITIEDGFLAIMIDSVTVKVNTDDLINSLSKLDSNKSLLIEQMSFPFEHDQLDLKIIFKSIGLSTDQDGDQGTSSSGKLKIDSFDGFLLWRLK